MFGEIENCLLSLPVKKNSEPAIAMPGHALFLAMDNFFRQIVNFSEQSFVVKVTVAYFATIAERQIALPWRLRIISPQTYLPVQERAGRWFDPDGSNTIAQPPKVCAWISQPAQRLMRTQSVCGCIPDAYTDAGVCIQAWRLWQLLTHLHHTHNSWQDGLPLMGICADLESSKIFRIFM